MRYASIATGVLATTVLAVPLAAPAMADSSSPAAVSVVRGEHVRGDVSRELRGGHEEKRNHDVQLQKALDAIVKAGAPGVVAEVRDADGAWRGHSGRADLKQNEPTRSDGLFRIGSVTKTFVSTVVLQLVQEGKMKLDDSVERHLPALCRTARTSPCGSFSATAVACTAIPTRCGAPTCISSTTRDSRPMLLTS